MTKSDLVEKIYEALKGDKVKKYVVEKVVTVLLETITNEVAGGNVVNFTGWGKFSPSVREAHTSRNPLTGAAVQVPDRKSVRFKAGKKFKEALK